MAQVHNETLVEKAVIVADAIASSGKLNNAQSDAFIDYVVDETVLKNNARTVRFRNETLDIDKIGIGARAAVPKSEAVDPGVRRGINTSKITLTPKEIMVPFEIGDTFGEINLEGKSVEDHIIRMFAKQLANDMEDMYINGNLLGPAVLENDILDGGSTTLYVKDSLLALQDGWNEIAENGNIADAAGANIGLSVFNKAILAMPTKFRRNRRNLRFFTSPDLAQLYMEKLSTRATQAGDDAARGNGLMPFGVPIVEVPLLAFLPSITEHITLTATTATSLANTNISGVSVHAIALNAAPTAAYIVTTDYVVDAALGTIARSGGGSAIGSGDVVKVTYSASPQMLLTHKENFIVGIGRDIRIEKDRNIYKGVNQYAITAKISVNFEENDALVKVRNIGSSV